MEPTTDSSAMTNALAGEAASSAGAAAVLAEEIREVRSEGSEDEALLSRTQRLISKIMSDEVNPNPRHLHALASILEKQESRYMP